METMVRIQHGMWSKRSEGDLHDSLGVSCGQGGSAEGAVEWAGGQGAGISDPMCYAYHADNDHYYPCGDRSGRALRVPASNIFSASSNIADQKEWISSVGPLTASFDVYTDFDSWTPSKGVYKYDGVSEYRGRHVCLVVGYDDSRGCWIVKNSWGSWWGDNGYVYIGYGQVTIDSAPKMGLTNPNPDPWTRKRHHNGILYQSGNGGTHRNLELVRAEGNAGIKHIYRNGGEGGDWSWNVAETLIGKDGNGNVISGNNVMGHPVLTGTSFNRNFEIMYWESSGYLHGWYFNQLNDVWYDTGIQGNGAVAGYPGFTQRQDSIFAITTRMSDGTLWEVRITHTHFKILLI
jgi:Papain family cysteine protease